MTTPTSADSIEDKDDFTDRLTELHTVTRDLMDTENEAVICEIGVEAAAKLLGLPLISIHLFDADKQVLEPAAATDATYDAFGTIPSFSADTESLAWENYQTGSVVHYEDVTETDKEFNSETTIVSEFHIPLGEYGIFLAGSDKKIVDEKHWHFELCKILAANVEVALERAQQIKKLKQYKTDLEETVSQLEESNAELEQFAYVASHDLQEPLRMISSYIDLLSMELGDDLTEEQEEYMDFITNGSERMGQLIDDLLTYSRVETDEREFVEADLQEIVENVKQDLKFRIKDTNGEVNINSLPTINADEGQMQQLFQNLISNALKYTDEDTDPVVNVNYEDFDDVVEIEIEDNGHGIPEDQQERIFEVFTRGASTDDDTGTGIGLSVCKRIVKGHGGDISVDSTVGKGTTFTFTLEKHLQ